MWVIRYLNGPMAGQIVQLKQGSNVIGRQSSCDIIIPQDGVSKKHCKIDVLQNEVLIVDTGSRNGTFINGMQVKSQRLSVNDKISFYNVVAELLEVPKESLAMLNPSSQTPPSYQGNAAIDMHQQVHQQAAPHPQHEPAVESLGPEKTGLPKLVDMVQVYIDEVVMPGIYKLTQWTEFRNVVLIFLGAFVFLVTSLSTIPLVRILKASIEKESQNRALTIARVVATVNRPILMKGAEAAVSVQFAQTETGVEKAYIISNMDRRIIAPATMAGSSSKDKFVNTAIQSDREQVGQIDSGTIAAIVPIKFYNPNTGTQSTVAFSVIIYDMGSLAVDDGRTISLFIQTLFIALLVGFVIFYFMYRLFEFPIRSINKQMDTALRDGHSLIEVDFMNKPVQKLVSNLSSLLNRIDGASEGSQGNSNIEHDRGSEMTNLVQLIGFPAIALQTHDMSVAALNSAFEEKTGLNSADLMYGPVSGINDQSLKLSIEDLLQRVVTNPDQMATNELEFGGVRHDVLAQGVFGKDKVSYVLVVILPMEEEEEAL